MNSTNITKNYDLPVHIIFIGEITGKQNLKINISAEKQDVFLTVKINTKKESMAWVRVPAFLNVFIKNTGENSKFDGKIIAQNHSELCIDIFTGFFNKNTGINVYTKVVAHNNSKTVLSGMADINKNCENCESALDFSVLAAPSAKIEFKPAQKIKSIPKNADHSANIYRGSAPQIEYLRSTGLSATEIKNALEEAFTNS